MSVDLNYYSLCGSSDEYTQLYPYAPDSSNLGGTHMKTAEQIKEENIVTKLVKIEILLLLLLIIIMITNNDFSSPPCSQL